MMAEVFSLTCLKSNQAAQYFERLFGTPTHLEFKHTAHLYDFGYQYLETVEDFKYTTLSQLDSYIYEIRTDREDNLQQHQILYKKWVKSSMLNYQFYESTAANQNNQLLVMLHGFISDASTFDAHIERLRSHVSILTIELPGHGRDQSPDTETWDFPFIQREWTQYCSTIASTASRYTATQWEAVPRCITPFTGK